MNIDPPKSDALTAVRSKYEDGFFKLVSEKRTPEEQQAYRDGYYDAIRDVKAQLETMQLARVR